MLGENTDWSNNHYCWWLKNKKWIFLGNKVFRTYYLSPIAARVVICNAWQVPRKHKSLTRFMLNFYVTIDLPNIALRA